MRAVGILLAACLFALAASANVAVPRCPTVYDGATSGVFDMSTQFSTTSLSANWFGLENSEVLGYEWAIISDALVTRSMQNRDCRLTQGFLGNPDVKGWTDVRKKTGVTAIQLQLEPTRTYYVVVRTTTAAGSYVFSNSNGLVVLPPELENEFREWSSKRTEEVRDHEEPIPKGIDCPIEQENRCRQSKESVHDFLNQIYGPPTFADDSQLALLYRYPTTAAAAAAIGVPEEFAGQPVDDDDGDDDDDDDDDDSSAIGGIIAGVVIGVILLMLLCLLLLALLGFFIARGDDNDKFNERITERRQEDVDADFGTRTERTIESEATRVEFPDIDTHSRLSEAPM